MKTITFSPSLLFLNGNFYSDDIQVSYSSSYFKDFTSSY